LKIEESTIDSYQNNPMKGTPLEELMIQHSITTTALKEGNEKNQFNESTKRTLGSFYR
jgi:hypothetical protein